MKRKEFYKNVVIDRKINAWENFVATDEYFLETRKKFKTEFFDQYNKAFELYISGDWERAKEEFEIIEVKFIYKHRAFLGIKMVQVSVFMNT